MGTRPRISNRVCSSENYEESRKLHITMLSYFHRQNKELIDSITSELKRPYTKVFGKLMPLTDEEARDKSLNIIWL